MALESSRIISEEMENKGHVIMHKEAISAAADLIFQSNYDITQWKTHPLHPNSSSPQAIDWFAPSLSSISPSLSQSSLLI